MFNSMKFFWLISTLLTVPSCRTVDTKSGLAFYGPDSKRARMAFETEVVIAVDDKLDKTMTKAQLIQKYDTLIEDHINTQLAHMFGAFTNHTSPKGTDFVTYPGIPRELPDVETVDAVVLTKNKFVVKYKYYDIVVFSSEFLSRSVLDHDAEFTYTEENGSKRKVTRKARFLNFYLPKEPGQYGLNIFAKGCLGGEANEVEGSCKKGKNRCTNQEYNTLGDFWYFWDPKQTNEYTRLAQPKACPIADKDLIVVKAHLTPMNSTDPGNASYPDYFRLYGLDKPRTHKTVVVHYLVGIDHDYSKKDLGYNTYKDAVNLLTTGSMGIFKPMVDKNKIAKHFPNTTPSQYTMFLEHEISPLVDIAMMVELFDPNETKPSEAGKLVRLGKAGLSEADVFVYDGHSGLGGYWAVDNFFDKGFKLPKNKYQVFFFNGCSTFAYYNHDYFVQKAEVDKTSGRTNLDVVTNGIGASFAIGPQSDARFLFHLLNGKQSSWVEILDDMYAVDKWDTALVQVNGDENNPRLPQTNGSCKGTPQYKDWKLHQKSGFCRPSNDPVF